MALLIVLLSPPQSSGVCICELCLVKFLFFPLFFLLFCFPSVLSGNACEIKEIIIYSILVQFCSKAFPSKTLCDAFHQKCV